MMFYFTVFQEERLQCGVIQGYAGVLKKYMHESIHWARWAEYSYTKALIVRGFGKADIFKQTRNFYYKI